MEEYGPADAPKPPLSTPPTLDLSDPAADARNLGRMVAKRLDDAIDSRDPETTETERAELYLAAARTIDHLTEELAATQAACVNVAAAAGLGYPRIGAHFDIDRRKARSRWPDAADRYHRRRWMTTHIDRYVAAVSGLLALRHRLNEPTDDLDRLARALARPDVRTTDLVLTSYDLHITLRRFTGHTSDPEIVAAVDRVTRLLHDLEQTAAPALSPTDYPR